MKPLVTLLDRLIFGLLSNRVRTSLRAPDKDGLAAYLDPALLTHPERFYTKPEASPAITESLTFVKRRFRYEVYNFRFPSAFTSPWPENNIVHGQYFKTTRKPDAPTVIVLHGWLAFSYLWFSTICRKLAQAGINSLMIQLPYHMDRQPRASRYSGEFSINGELKRSFEMIRQAVSDTRSIINWVKSKPTSQAGIWGISLGGWIGALVTAAEPRLDFSVLMIPAVRPDDILWHSPLCPPLKEAMCEAGITYEQLQEALKIVTPKYFRPALSPEKILLMEAELDLGVRPHTVEELWEAWGRPHLRRYSHSHMSIVLSVRALKDGVDFIRNATR
ncbi:MAG: alpha/beta hydrolase family protein [Acidobacteria bacterium]|nr:alpha/beta hydrolase family protein [Acidobacteriota bacterium]